MSEKPFRYFTIFAEMRTGSNFLEENINQFADLQGYGEMFNPHFIGGAKKDNLLGVSLAERDDNPVALIERCIAEDPSVIPGFRFFNDHDPRILNHVLDDRTCGKAILTRNPLDSYVSRKIAAETGQWRLTNLKHQKTAKITYDHAEFLEHLEATQAFQLLLLNSLQSSGQTAFYIGYDDIHSLDVLNGLARFLGSKNTAEHIDKKLKKQNPSALEDKVSNFAEMQDALRDVDFMNLNRTPNFEPRRGAGVPGFVAGSKAALLYLPVAGTPADAVKTWIATLDDLGVDDLISAFNQKTLRQWREENPGFLTLSVVSHPLLRAHRAFCSHILGQAPGFAEQRKTILQKFPIEVPKTGSGEGLDKAAHKAAFIAFLKFVKASLAQQTGLRIDPVWASQSAILQGAAEQQMPAMILREADLANALPMIARQIGRACPPLPSTAQDGPYQLGDIYDARLEALGRDVYQRDFQQFGFGDWRQP